MASNVTVQSVLGKISQDHLECSICSYRYKEPKILDCLHSFCLKCLQELQQRQEPQSTKLTCPLCRQDTKLKGDVTSLPNNFALGALVEEITMQEQLLEGQGSEIKCQNCDEGSEAVSRCMNCDSFLCLECDNAHRRMAALKTHDVSSLAKLRSGEITFKSKLREEIPKCGKHPDQNLSIYCDTCEQLACAVCSILDHAKHSLSGPKEAVKKIKPEIDQLIAEAEKNQTKWSAASEQVENIQGTLESTFNNTTEKISRKADKEIDRIRGEEKKLKQDAKKTYKDRQKKLDDVKYANSTEIGLARSKLDEMKHLSTQASCHEILDHKQKLTHNLREMVKEQPRTASDKLSYMDFQESNIEPVMGKLILQEKPNPELKAEAAAQVRQATPQREWNWQKKTEIIKFCWAYDAVVFSNNEVVIIDVGKKKMMSYSPGIPVSPGNPQELKIDGLLFPKRVAVNKDDQLIVLTEDSTVKILSRNYQILHSFKPGIYKTPERIPTCLTVDATNQILVGYGMEGETSIHRPDGSFLRLIATPGVDSRKSQYMTTHGDGNLVYTTGKELALDRFGNPEQDVLYATIPGIASQHCTYRGVCCDTDGIIYAAVFNKKDKTYEIHEFSPTCKHLRCIIKGCGNVQDITLTPQGDMVAAAVNKVDIYGPVR